MAGEYRPKPPDQIRRNMAAIRSAENKTEAAVRRALHAMGLRYRKYVAGLVGRPDIVFPTERVAVFIDGDYWHGRLLREQGVEAVESYYRSREQRGYWVAKMQRNVSRDDFVSDALRAEGWRVLRYWESDAKRDPAAVAKRIARVVRVRRAKRLGAP